MKAIIYGRPECTGCLDAAELLTDAGVRFKTCDIQTDSMVLVLLADNDQPIDDLPRVALYLNLPELRRVVGALERASAMTGPS